MEEKTAVTQVFNLVSKLYDNPSLRFFPACAEKMVDYAKIKRSQKVLDIATGTGMVAHVMASSEWSISPCIPTATKLSRPKATPYKSMVDGELRALHVMASEEVKIVPPLPTAT